MPPWEQLLHRLLDGLDHIRLAGQPVPDWVLGGGTALMLRTGHRTSKDIDTFIDDPQYLSFLSPRLGGESIWGCDAFDESPHHLKLVFPEGEIDFIVAAAITGLPAEQKAVGVSPGEREPVVIAIEHPVETALKKLHYRGSMLKVRDIFDIAVVDALFPQALQENLYRVAHVKLEVLARLAGISDQFLRAELDELAISERWRTATAACRERVREIVEAMPK